MENRTFTELVTLAKMQDRKAMEELMERMVPLMKKEAGKCFFLDFEDAYQEMALGLLEAISAITDTSHEYKVIRYLSKSIINKFNFLCSKNIAKNKHETTTEESFFEFQLSPDCYQEVLAEICYKNLSKALPPTRRKQLWITLCTTVFPTRRLPRNSIFPASMYIESKNPYLPPGRKN